MESAPAAYCLGWLLRANRIAGPQASWRSGREFARVFRRDNDQPLAPSHITRWESGQMMPSHRTIRRYAHLLGLPSDSLVAISDALVRAEGRSPARYFSERIDTAGDRHRLHELLERASTASMTGPEWSELTEIAAAIPGLVLHPVRLWPDIIHRLLEELSLATYGEWLQRQEAMSRLLEHPDARPHAIAACIAVADDPASPVVIEPISLLEVTADPRATRYILDQIEQPRDYRTLHGALLAALHKVKRSHFSADQRARLAVRLRDHLDDAALNPALRSLAAEIGDRLRRPLSSRSPAGDAISHTVSESIAVRALAELDDPPMLGDALAVLVGQLLYQPDPDHRLITGMLLAASPCRVPVGRALVDGYTKELSRMGNSFPPTTLRTLTDLNVEVHRPLIRRILTTPSFSAAQRYAAAWATPHCPGTDSPKTWREILRVQHEIWKRDGSDTNASILHGITYGIGTDMHWHLLRRIQAEHGMPAAARTTASWLLRSRRE